MDKESVYLVVGTVKIDKKFAKHVRALSAEDAKTKILKEVGTAGSVTIESVFVSAPKKANKRFG